MTMRSVISLISLGIETASRFALRVVLGLRLPIARKQSVAIESDRDQIRKRLVAAVEEVRRLSAEMAIAKTAAIEADERCAEIDARIAHLRQPVKSQAIKGQP